MVRSGFREPARSDVESPSNAALKGFKRIIIGRKIIGTTKNTSSYIRRFLELASSGAPSRCSSGVILCSV